MELSVDFDVEVDWFSFVSWFMLRSGSVASKVNESAIDIGVDEFDVSLLADIKPLESAL